MKVWWYLISALAGASWALFWLELAGSPTGVTFWLGLVLPSVVIGATIA